MSITIKPIEQHERYEVNGKLIYKDAHNDTWIAYIELTTQELNAFNNYKKAVIENPDLKTHTAATY